MESWTLTWTKLTPLNQAGIEEIPTNLSGVYRLSHKADDGNFYVFYVGQSEDVRMRLLQHLNGETNARIKSYLENRSCFFRYAKITQDYIRAAVERQMYKQYQPACNEQEPAGRDDVKANLT